MNLASAPHITELGVDVFAQRMRMLRARRRVRQAAERAVLPEFDAQWVMKRGADGAELPEGRRAAPGVAVVDTTGAGNALAAGDLIGGPDLAIHLAACCVGLIGAMPPHRRTSEPKRVAVWLM